MTSRSFPFGPYLTLIAGTVIIADATAFGSRDPPDPGTQTPRRSLATRTAPDASTRIQTQTSAAANSRSRRRPDRTSSRVAARSSQAPGTAFILPLPDRADRRRRSAAAPD